MTKHIDQQCRYSLRTTTYILLLYGAHESCQSSPVERVWIGTVTQQYFQTVDVLERNKVDRPTEEITAIWIGTTTQEQLCTFSAIVLNCQLQRLLGQ